MLKIENKVAKRIEQMNEISSDSERAAKILKEIRDSSTLIAANEGPSVRPAFIRCSAVHGCLCVWGELSGLLGSFLSSFLVAEAIREFSAQEAHLKKQIAFGSEKLYKLQTQFEAKRTTAQHAFMQVCAPALLMHNSMSRAVFLMTWMTPRARGTHSPCMLLLLAFCFFPYGFERR